MIQDPTYTSELNIINKTISDSFRESPEDPNLWRCQVTAICPAMPLNGWFSNPWRPRTDCIIRSANIQFDTILSSSCEFEIWRNDKVIGTLNPSSGMSEHEISFKNDAGFNRQTQLRVKTVDSGLGYTSLTIHIIFETYKKMILSGVLVLPTTGGGG